jgi:hypothetical protein
MVYYELLTKCYQDFNYLIIIGINVSFKIYAYFLQFLCYCLSLFNSLTTQDDSEQDKEIKSNNCFMVKLNF